MGTVSQQIEALTKEGSFREEEKKYLSTVLKHYIFEGLGYETASMRSKQFEQFLQQITMHEWVNKTLEYGRSKNLDLSLETSPQETFIFFTEQSFKLRIDERIELGTLARKSKGNYSSALSKCLRFVGKQLFWKELFPEIPKVLEKRSPRSKGQGFAKPRLKGQGFVKAPAKHTEDYGLKLSELPEELQLQFEQIRVFRQTGGEKDWARISLERQQAGEQRGRRPKVITINDQTWNDRLQACLEFGGYLVRIVGFSIKALRIQHFVDPTLIENFADWRLSYRNAATNGQMMCEAAIGIAKALNFHLAKRRDWTDVDLVVELRGLRSELQEKYDSERKKYETDKWRGKNLSHFQVRECAEKLRDYCAPFLLLNQGRTTKVVERSQVVQLWNLQTYGIVKHFTYLPVRQQEPCQQRLGETFFVETDSNGKRFYRVAKIYHKNYWRTGKKREYKIPSILNSFYDDWLEKRSLVENALKSEENWLEFWGCKPGHLEKLKSQVEAAKQGRFHNLVKNEQEYLLKKQEELDKLLRRVKALPQARKNFYQHQSVFFNFGFNNPELFGLPLKSLTTLVRAAMGRATFELYGVEVKLNPHAFRNIAAKWVQDNKGNSQKSALLQGHSEEEEKDYARKLTFEEDELEDFTDGWWEILGIKEAA